MGLNLEKFNPKKTGLTNLANNYKIIGREIV